MKLFKVNNQIFISIVISFCALLIISQLNSVQSFDPPPIGERAYGIVTYGGNPVYNAKVSLIVDYYVEDIDYTDSEGNYFVFLDEILQSKKRVTIKVEKSGYTTLYKETYLYPDEPTVLNIEWKVDLRCKGYVYDHVGTALIGATVKLIEVSSGGTLKSDTTDSNGYYDFTKSVMENLYCKLQVSKTGYETQYITLYASSQTTTKNFRIASDSATKIAAFFYATDYTVKSTIEGYCNQLINEEGFEFVDVDEDDEYDLYFEDVSNWKIKFLQIEDLEDEDTFVFIYIGGHGEYLEEEDNSRLRLTNEEIEDPTYMYSNELADEIDDHLESKNIFVFVSSCHSGGFVDDVKKAGRFVIAEASIDAVTYYLIDENSLPELIPLPETAFSYFYFDRIHNDLSDRSAYNAARSLTIEYFEDVLHPVYHGTELDHGPPDPVYNDQIAYTWFKWW